MQGREELFVYRTENVRRTRRNDAIDAAVPLGVVVHHLRRR